MLLRSFRLVAAALGALSAASAASSSSSSSASASDCAFGGLVTLARGENDSQAIVYNADCDTSALAVDSKGVLKAGALHIDQVASIPDVKSLILDTNNITALKLQDETLLTKLSLTSNAITSFEDIAVPSSLTYLGLSWNYIKTFDGMNLPSTLQELWLGGNLFQSLAGVEFPSSLTLLYIHDLPLTTVMGASFPDSIEFLSLQSCELTSLEGVTFPSSLTNLDVSENQLTSVPNGLPSGMVQLNFMNNALTELYNVTMPKGATTLNFSGNSITTVQGVSLPWSLKALDLGSTTITTFEISRSDYSTLQNLETLQATVDQSSCSTPGAELVTVNGISACVISSDQFAETYGSLPSSASGSASSSQSTSAVSPDASSGSSTVVIVVVVVAVVLAVVLAAVGYRVYQHKQGKASGFSDSDPAGFFANQSTAAKHRHDGTGNTNASEDDDDVGSNNSYAFNTIFSGGKVTVMGGTAVESALVKYRIPASEVVMDRPIAKGGFGVVYLATYQDQTVVVKKMLPDKATDDRCLGAFIEEIKLLSTLSHAKVIRFIGVTWSMLSDMAVLIEYMPNGDLDALLKRQCKRKSEHPDEFGWYNSSAVLPAKAGIALDILEGMIYLHSFPSPIIHRDLKSKNVLLSDSYEAKLTDFGISREWQVDATMTAGIGTMAWIAPEVLRGERYTEKADIYSFGVILSELSTLRKPFDGVTNALIVLKVTSEETPSLGDECPDDVRELAQRCLSYNASDRPSASVAHYELRTLLKVHSKFEL